MPSELDEDLIARASLFAQLQPNVLSKQEACLFGTVRDQYFRARDQILVAWYQQPDRYLSFDACMENAALRALGLNAVWSGYSFLSKNGYINAGLVHADAAALKQSQADGGKAYRPVCTVPVRPHILRPCSARVRAHTSATSSSLV